ncbi:MAG TPA: undecaprenyl-phosphate glucose phosphotransferase [Stellaceae bacterium]|nr:undecaprenyl-phosphate glucose phosphotransferase [Stellaceae bacterium]
MPAHSTPKLRLLPRPDDGGVRLVAPAGSAPAAGTDRPIAPFFVGDWLAILVGAFRLGDIGVVAGTGFAVFWLPGGAAAPPPIYQWQVLAGCLLAANCFHFARLYTVGSLRRPLRHLAAVAANWAGVVLAIAAAGFFTGTADAAFRDRIVLWALSALAGLVGARLVYWTWLARWSRDSKLVANVAIVGSQAAAARLARHIASSSEGEARIVGAFHTSASAQASPAEDDVRALIRLARRTRVDEVVVSIHCAGDMGDAFAALADLPVDVKVCLEFGDGTAIEPREIPTLLLCRRPLAGWRIVVKRAMDIALSAVLLVFFMPLMLGIAGLIKLDSRGPVIFRQRRFGFNRQPITVYKFRTMYCGSSDDAAVAQARPRDPRVTRLGRFLRRSSLDELPQLLNVLRGDMSLVGPRPHATAHDEKYAPLIDGYLARHRVQPGITGWAQVKGFRGETDTLEKMIQRVEHDLFYIEHWSPLFDLRILALTLRYGFYHRNAY